MYLLNQVEGGAHSSGNVVASTMQENDAPVQEREVMPEPEVATEDVGRDVAYIGEDAMEAPSPSMSLRDVKITPLSSGFLVKVGCQSVAVETPEKLLAALAKYYENPSEFERKWYEKPVINRLENIL